MFESNWPTNHMFIVVRPHILVDGKTK